MFMAIEILVVNGYLIRYLNEATMPFCPVLYFLTQYALFNGINYDGSDLVLCVFYISF